MTVTLELPPDMEALLSAKAGIYGLTLPDYLFSLLEAGMDEGYSMTVEQTAVVKERLAEAETGDKGILLEDYWAEVMAKREARIAGTRMKVAHIAEEHTRLGMTPEQIVEAHPHLALPQINAALAYYYSNRDAVETTIAASLAYTDQARQQAGVSPLAARLRGLKVPLNIGSGPASYPAPTRTLAGDRLSKRTKDRQ